MGGYEVTDKQWERIKPLLPSRGKWAHSRADDRTVLKAFCTCYALDAGGNEAYVTAWQRLNRWQKEGVWTQIWQTLIANLDEEGKIEWTRAFLDGSFVPAKKEEISSTKVGKGTW